MINLGTWTDILLAKKSWLRKDWSHNKLQSCITYQLYFIVSFCIFSVSEQFLLACEHAPPLLKVFFSRMWYAKQEP